MKCHLFRKEINLKVVSVLIVICFLAISMNRCIANPGSQKDSSCYGFIAPLFKCENITVEDQINCKTKNMVNDLLGEQIAVYWTSTNITASIRKINDETGQEMFFEKGTFIIPFTGDNVQDKKIIAVACDYNQSSEIEAGDLIKIPVYLLMEPLITRVYQLSEVKIAQYKGVVNTGCDQYYLEIARKCGFLTFEYLDDKELTKKLNNNAFNVIMWPGDSLKLSFLYTGKSAPIYWVIEDVKYGVSRAVRDFVAAGGGYIGSCAGACRAACGAQFETRIGNVTIDWERKAYNPKLCSIGLMAISDVIFKSSMLEPGAIESKIFNDMHPVTYGLDSIASDWLCGGPQFVDIGKNSQIIALFHNTNTYLDGTPSWISSNFGNGKAVIFSTHPEIEEVKMGHAGEIIISNALYYTTSKGIKELQTFHPTNLSFIGDAWKKTSNLTIDTNNKADIFEKIKTIINGTISEITNLSEKLQSLKELIRKIADEKNIHLDSKNNTSPGNFSISPNLVYLDIFIKYFTNTTKTLDTLEKIYPLLKNDTGFIKQIETLKTELSEAINETRCMCSESQKIYPHFYRALLEYQQAKILLKIRENVIEENVHKLNWQIPSGFYYIPQTYFNSLKLLRASWYNYETNMAI